MKNQGETPPITQGVDQSRRRLTKAGLAAPAVLGVLASRSVLGNSLHHCTPSGHISGFASPPAEGATKCAQLGLSPDDYKEMDPATWPDGFTDDEDNPLPFNQAPTTAGVFFNNAYVIKNPGRQFVRIATVLEVLKGEYIQGVADANQNNMLAVNNGTFSDPDFTLGREAIAACMNANRAVGGYPSGFPISDDQVVNMFNNVISGGTDFVTSTADWNRLEVIEYFQSLHGG